jgi:hypothetical protein
MIVVMRSWGNGGNESVPAAHPTSGAGCVSTLGLVLEKAQTIGSWHVTDSSDT